MCFICSGNTCPIQLWLDSRLDAASVFCRLLRPGLPGALWTPWFRTRTSTSQRGHSHRILALLRVRVFRRMGFPWSAEGDGLPGSRSRQVKLDFFSNSKCAAGAKLEHSRTLSRGRGLERHTWAKEKHIGTLSVQCCYDDLAEDQVGIIGWLVAGSNSTDNAMRREAANLRPSAGSRPLSTWPSSVTRPTCFSACLKRSCTLHKLSQESGKLEPTDVYPLTSRTAMENACPGNARSRGMLVTGTWRTSSWNVWTSSGRPGSEAPSPFPPFLCSFLWRVWGHRWNSRRRSLHSSLR